MTGKTGLNWILVSFSDLRFPFGCTLVLCPPADLSFEVQCKEQAI
jgi:hypothetical protein